MEQQTEIKPLSWLPARIKYGGYRLKFYRDEHEKFEEVYSIKISGEESRIVFNKLRKYYKLNVGLDFGSRSNGHFGGYYIKMPYHSSIGLLAHEIAHALEKRKYGSTGHTKRTMRIIKQVVGYCKRHNYWQDEIAKRTAPKPIKPEPTKDEIRLAKIEKKKQALARYEKKLKYYTKLYSNKIKSAKRSLTMLEKNLLGQHKNNVEITADNKVETTNKGKV